MIVTFAVNGIELEYTQKELYEVILDVTSGKVMFDGLHEWVLNHQE
jgi:death-on-curing protein